MDERVLVVHAEWRGGQGEALVDEVLGQAVLARHLGVVWLTPAMDGLFLDPPSSRRRFLDRLKQYEAARGGNPDYLRQLWQEERGRLFAKLRENGMIDLLDHHLSSGGLDVMTAPKLPGR